MSSLPADIVLIVLEQCASFESQPSQMELRSWSLISRSWTAPCQALLFHTLHLNSLAQSKYGRTALARVLYVATRPHIRVLTREVSLMWNGNEMYGLSVMQLSNLLVALLPALCHIELSWVEECPNMRSFDPLSNVKSWTFSPHQLSGIFKSWTDFLSLQLRRLSSSDGQVHPIVQRHGPLSLHQLHRVHLRININPQAFVDCIRAMRHLSLLEEVIIHAICFYTVEAADRNMPKVDCRFIEQTGKLLNATASAPLYLCYCS